MSHTHFVGPNPGQKMEGGMREVARRALRFDGPEDRRTSGEEGFERPAVTRHRETVEKTGESTVETTVEMDPDR